MAVAFGVLVSAAALSRAEEGRLDVRVAPGLESYGRRVERAWPAIVADLARVLGFPPRGARIDVVKGHEEMVATLGTRVPEWAAGVHQGGRIVMRADVADRGAPLRTFESTLRHEAVHLAWWLRAGVRARLLPRWFEEGLAEELGGGISVAGQGALEIEAGLGRTVQLRDWDETWPTEERSAAIAYAAGRDFLRWFLAAETGGPEVLAAVLRDLADGRATALGPAPRPPFEGLVEEHAGRPLDLLLEDWRLDLERRSRPWFHLFGQDLGATWMLLLSIVSVVAFFVVRRVRRRAYEALPDE